MLKIDQKITIWDRFCVPDECKDELLKFLNKDKEATATDILEWVNNNGYEACDHETLTDTGEELTPAGNDGASTVEVIQIGDDNREEHLWENAPVVPTILEETLERYEQIAADTKKEFLYDKHTGHWAWCGRDDGGVPCATGFSSRLEALLDAIEPYLNPED